MHPWPGARGSGRWPLRRSAGCGRAPQPADAGNRRPLSGPDGQAVDAIVRVPCNCSLSEWQPQWHSLIIQCASELSAELAMQGRTCDHM